MTWSDSQTLGFALAALLANDRDATRVEGGVAPELVDRARAVFDPARQRDRRALVAELVAKVRPAADARRLPARLAEVLTRAAAKAPARRDPLRRANDDALVRVLLRLARNASGQHEP